MRLSGRVLEPIERLSEILFGLIMALTITGAVSVATADDSATMSAFDPRRTSACAVQRHLGLVGRPCLTILLMQLTIVLTQCPS